MDDSGIPSAALSSTASPVIPEAAVSLLSTSVLNFSQVMARTAVNYQPRRLTAPGLHTLPSRTPEMCFPQLLPCPSLRTTHSPETSQPFSFPSLFDLLIFEERGLNCSLPRALRPRPGLLSHTRVHAHHSGPCVFFSGRVPCILVIPVSLTATPPLLSPSFLLYSYFKKM